MSDRSERFGRLGSPRERGRRPVRWLLLVPLLVLAGCGAGGDDKPAGGSQAAAGAAASGPFAGCAALATAPPSAPPAVAGSLAPGGAPDPRPVPMPALDLPCFADDSTVHMRAIRGPAVVNLWASWCGPCREELPTLQRYADRAAGQLTVVGVVTEDDRSRAASLAEDLGIEFPTLYDQRGELRRAVQRTALPVTLFVDGAGQIRYLYNADALDEATLALLAEQYLGVVVS
jgi:thiol-disulfide isomerase/thioredoxin